MEDTIDILSQMPAYVFWKDLKLRFQGGNSQFIQMAGCGDEIEIKNKTDYQMPWKAYAGRYRKDDRHVIRRLTLFQSIEPHRQAVGNKIQVYVKKIPLFDTKGKLRGIIGNYMEVCPTPIRLKTPAINLPQQQRLCLKYLALGLTAKLIAKRMKLSPRTIEYYIEILKTKLNCHSKFDLVRIAWEIENG